MKTIEGALTDEQIVEAGYMHTVEDDEPLFAFDRKELIAMVRELLARAQPPVADGQSGGGVAQGWKLVPDHANADAIVTSLYRRFKDWSKRGFGPDEVTWCEVKADVLALLATSPAAQKSESAAQDEREQAYREATKPCPETSGVGEYCQPGDRREPRWIVIYDDADRSLSIFEDEQDARDCFANSEAMGWNCWLFSPTPRVRAASPAAPAQSGEPVAYQGKGRDGNWHEFTKEMFETAGGDSNPSVRKLYAAPQPSQSAKAGEPTGDQVRAIIKSVGSLGTNHADAPMEYVLAGWRAAKASGSAVVLDDERAAFEAWANGKGICVETFEGINGQIRYIAPTANDGWGAWKARAASPQATAAQAEAEVSEERGLTDEQIREHFDTHAIYALEGKKLYWNEALSFAHAILTAAQPATGGDRE